eukprot:489419-Pyramimonas_sp.AAC.1
MRRADTALPLSFSPALARLSLSCASANETSAAPAPENHFGCHKKAQVPNGRSEVVLLAVFLFLALPVLSLGGRQNGGSLLNKDVRGLDTLSKRIAPPCRSTRRVRGMGQACRL